MRNRVEIRVQRMPFDVMRGRWKATVYVNGRYRTSAWSFTRRRAISKARRAYLRSIPIGEPEVIKL